VLAGGWGLATFASGLARASWQLLVARAALGVGEAGFYPASASLLSDYFDKKQRGRAFGAFNAASAVGAAAGLIGGAAIAARTGWRPAFFIAGGPAILLGLLALRIREPERGAAEGSGAASAAPLATSWREPLKLLRVRSYVAALVASMFVFSATQATGFWLALNTSRTFGLDLTRAGTVAGVCILTGGIAGPVGGGWLVDWRGRRSAQAHLEVVAAAGILGALAAVIALSTSSLALYMVGLVVAVSAALAPTVAMTAMVQGLVIPPLRAGAYSLLALVTQIVSAIAPYAIGALSDRLQDLRLALLFVAPSLLVLAAGTALWGMPALKADTLAMEERWTALSAEAIG
jgi:MFS family permease